MKEFEFPDIEIIRFALSDILTTSNEFPLDEELDTNQLPPVRMS